MALVLGDNIFDGTQLTRLMNEATAPDGGAIFAYEVSDPERYGVVSFDENGTATAIEEKPSEPQSNFAVVGLYFYDNDVVKIASEITPSERGELEITSVNDAYLKQGKLRVHRLHRGDVWLDTGTIDSMSEASAYVEVLQKRTGTVIGSPEVAAYHQGFIDADTLEKLAAPMLKSGYGQYLLDAARE